MSSSSNSPKSNFGLISMTEHIKPGCIMMLPVGALAAGGALGAVAAAVGAVVAVVVAAGLLSATKWLS